MPPPPPAIAIVPKSTRCFIDFPLNIYNGLGEGTTRLHMPFSCSAMFHLYFLDNCLAFSLLKVLPINLLGVFISESHYLVSLLKTNQYDTIYHEHLRYYSLRSLKKLFA